MGASLVLAVILLLAYVISGARRDIRRSERTIQAVNEIQAGLRIDQDTGEGKIYIPPWDEFPKDILEEANGDKVRALKLLRERGQGKVK